MKTILVTGGTGDLGGAVVPRLAEDHRCVLLLHGKGNPPEIPNVVAIESVEKIQAFAPFFGLVSLAGAFAGGAKTDTLGRMLDANLYSFVRAFEAVEPHLEEGGRIVAISSAASQALPGGLAAYNAAKAALNAYLLTIAKDLAPRGITVNAFLPTTLDTPANRPGNDPASLVPLESVASWISALLSERGSVTTGQLVRLGR